MTDWISDAQWRQALAERRMVVAPLHLAYGPAQLAADIPPLVNQLAAMGPCDWTTLEVRVDRRTGYLIASAAIP